MWGLCGDALIAETAWSLSFAEFLRKSFCFANFFNLASKVYNVYSTVFLAVLEQFLYLGI